MRRRNGRTSFHRIPRKARSGGQGRGQRSGCFNLSTWAEKHSTGNQKNIKLIAKTALMTPLKTALKLHRIIES